MAGVAADQRETRGLLDQVPFHVTTGKGLVPVPAVSQVVQKGHP